MCLKKLGLAHRTLLVLVFLATGQEPWEQSCLLLGSPPYHLLLASRVPAVTVRVTRRDHNQLL